jgi:hypothetical protein
VAEGWRKLKRWRTDTSALQGAEPWRAVLWAPLDVARRLTVPSMTPDGRAWDRWCVYCPPPLAQQFMVTRFAASPPTDNCPQPKEAQPNHCLSLTSD